MKKLIPVLIVFYLIRDGVPMTVTNVSQSEIESYYGKSVIVDKATYDAAVAALPPFTIPPDPVRDQAILDAKNTQKTDSERIEALIKAVGL